MAILRVADTLKLLLKLPNVKSIVKKKEELIMIMIIITIIIIIFST